MKSQKKKKMKLELKLKKKQKKIFSSFSDKGKYFNV